MNTRVTFFGILVLFWLGTGCRPAEPLPVEPPRAMTAGRTFEVVYRSRPDPIPLNEHFTLEVEVRMASSGQTPDDLSIGVDADMPAHGHGINTSPTVQALGSGRFEASGLLFHMPGQWELYIDVARGALRERAVFPLILK